MQYAKNAKAGPSVWLGRRHQRVQYYNYVNVNKIIDNNNNTEFRLELLACEFSYYVNYVAGQTVFYIHKNLLGLAKTIWPRTRQSVL